MSIKPGIGLLQQLKSSNIHPYNKLMYLESIAEEAEEIRLDHWRYILTQQAFTMLKDKLSIEEYDRIIELIQSPDRDTIYMAKLILKSKQDEGTEENRE